MPLDVSKLKLLPSDKHQAMMEAMHSLKETLDVQQADMNRAAVSVFRAEGDRIRAEAEARQAAIDARDLAIQQNVTLKQLLEESRAQARSWKSTAISLGIALITVLVGWLLTAVNAAQVLSHLVHH